MKKNTYFVISIEENGKHYAYAETVSNCNNLLSFFAGIKGAYSINAADSKKEARQIADCWNECYRNNGTYLFA